MKNKILIGIVIILIALLIVVRYIFNEKFVIFKASVSQYEIAQLENFKKVKDSKIVSFSTGDKEIYQLLIDQFDDNKSITIRDTSFSFLYLSRGLKYKIHSLAYIDCLYKKCLVEDKNKENQKLINGKEAALKKKFRETFSLWYPKLKNEKLLKKIKNGGDCSTFFPDMYEVSYDENAWKDFEKFLLTYNSETRAIQIQNKQIENQFTSSVANTRYQLRRNVLDYFDNKLSESKSQIITTDTVPKTFNSSTIGVIAYSIIKTNFNQNAYKVISDDAFREQWKSNSLRTGAMPYSSCYGSNNYCESYNCSKISVKTGGSDVLVTIKNINREVVRHAYINGGDSYTFDVYDGQYQVFFYSGNGWNPNKVMITTSCGKLFGGFVSGESITKDNYISLNSQIMTYELILQQNGNLNTQQSSMDEAFN